MKNWFWIPLAAIAGVIAGSWGPREDIESYKESVQAERTQKKVSGTAGTGGGISTTISSSSETFIPAFSATVPLTVTKPDLMSPSIRDREKSGWVSRICLSSRIMADYRTSTISDCQAARSARTTMSSPLRSCVKATPSP